MKKILMIALCLTVLAGVMAGCGKLLPNDGKLNIVTTIFPEYDWVMQILGDQTDNAEVTLLLDNGVDEHIA